MVEFEYTYTATGGAIRKSTYEKQKRSFDFGKWIVSPETLSSPTVICLDSDGNDVSSTHIGTGGDAPAVNGDLVEWWLLESAPEGVYDLKIRSETSTGQKLEGRVVYYNCA